MPIDEEQLDFEQYAAEKDRTYLVLDLFEEVQAKEALRLARLPRGKRKYLRKITGCGEIKKIGIQWIDWSRRPGEIVTPIFLSEKLCRTIEIEDKLDLTVGLYDGYWYVISLNGITNGIGETTICDFGSADEETADEFGPPSSETPKLLN